ncbi:hypothetical protein AAC387_Pa08g1475 [Persea americana]
MSKYKAKNLLDSLYNLLAPGISKTPVSGPSSTLGKWLPVDSFLPHNLKKAKDELLAKFSGDSNPLSKWLEDPLSPLPPQHNPPWWWKSSSGPSREAQSALGEGVMGSPSLAL